MNGGKAFVILVDDNPTNLRIGKNVLMEEYNVATAPSAKKLFSLLEHNHPDLILLDVDMPEMNGYEAIRILKSKPETQDIPVIFLTARNESDDEETGLSVGSVDYITKPFQPSILRKRIEIHLLLESQKKILEKQARDLRYFNDQLRKAFSTYLSEEVVEELITDPAKLQLGGITRYMTAMFTDIYNFTPVAALLSPDELVLLLNEYLSIMSDAILEAGGTIDKYEGDAIVAFFGAPLEASDHALRACRSAVMMKRLEGELNKKFLAGGRSSAPLLTRIGINTGDMVVGNMGTKRKMNYTIIGNEVNISSRLEGVNKRYGTWILASEKTVQAAGDQILTRRLDRIRMVGITEPVRIYELVETEEGASPALIRAVELFHRGLDRFEERDWAAAADIFRQVLDRREGDGPSRLYLDRCREYLRSPPERDWDGVFSCHEK